MFSKIKIPFLKYEVAAGLIAVLSVFTILGSLFSCSRSDQKPAAPLEKITLAYSTPPYTVLIDVALKQGYFQQAGLAVTPLQYPYGKVAFDALLKGEADLATVGETPFIFAIMKGEALSVIATIQTSNKNNAIIARKDKGILAPRDLRGRKIGATFGTVGEFFMDAFLVGQGISRRDVNVVNLPPEAMQHALANGNVDAVSSWSPDFIRLRKHFGEQATVFRDPDIYTQTFSVVAKQDYIRQSPGKVKKVLRALVMAEDFARQNPGEAQRIVADASGMDQPLINEMWGDNTFRVTLDQSLLLAMEDESRWAIGNGLLSRTSVPNYLKFIYFDGLEIGQAQSREHTAVKRIYAGQKKATNKRCGLRTCGSDHRSPAGPGRVSGQQGGRGAATSPTK